MCSRNSFYTLPLNTISSIVCAVDFNELSNPIETIKSIVSGTSQSYKSEGITILNAFKVEKIPPLDLGQCIEILSKYQECELCSKLGDLYSDDKLLPKIDWKYEITTRDKKIAELQNSASSQFKRIDFPPVTEKPKDFDGNIISAIKAGKLSSVQYLCEHNMIDKNGLFEGETPLHWACESGMFDIVRYLCEKQKVDKESKTSEYKAEITPLFSSCVGFGNKEITKYLIEEQKVDINAKNDQGSTVIHYACSWGKLDTLQYLCEELKISAELRNNYEYTPLHYASQRNNLIIVKYLCERAHVNINALNKNKYTALHSACQSGSLEVVRYLCEEQKSDKEAKDRNGYTPLHTASYFGHMEIVMYLCETQKVNTKSLNNDGEKPEEVAKYEEIRDYLKKH